MRIVATRMEALCSQVDGRPEDAEQILIAELPLVRQRRRQPDLNQFLHQLGLVRLALGQSMKDPAVIELARLVFDEAIATMPEIGYGYYRARCLLALGRTLAAAGDRDGAIEALTRSIDLSRELKSRRLLALGLDARARAEIGSL